MPSYRPKPVSPRVRLGHPLQSELLRFYAVGERAGDLLLEEVSGAHATLNAATASQRVTCPYGRAFSFAGNGHRAIAPGDGLPQASDPRSVAFLFRTTSSVYRHAVSWGNAGGGMFGIGINAGGLTVRNQSTSVTVGSGLNDGRWHLVVVATGPGDAVHPYADGLPIGQRALALDTPADASLYIASYALDNQTLLGDLAMLAIWGRTLAAPEVAALMADPFGVARPRSRLIEYLASSASRPAVAAPAPRARWFPGLRRGR